MTKSEFRSIFGEHKDIVYRFAWRMAGSVALAEDVTQECFLTLFRHPERFDSRRGAMRTFLVAIARNLILKRWRGDNRSVPLENETSGAANESDLSQFETKYAVARAIALLPPLQRESLIFAEYEELSVEEIAIAVGAEASAVKSRLHRARENLRRMLAPLRNSVCTR